MNVFCPKCGAFQPAYKDYRCMKCGQDCTPRDPGEWIFINIKKLILLLVRHCIYCPLVNGCDLEKDRRFTLIEGVNRNACREHQLAHLAEKEEQGEKNILGEEDTSQIEDSSEGKEGLEENGIQGSE